MARERNSGCRRRPSRSDDNPADASVEHHALLRTRGAVLRGRVLRGRTASRSRWNTVVNRRCRRCRCAPSGTRTNTLSHSIFGCGDHGLRVSELPLLLAFARVAHGGLHHERNPRVGRAERHVVPKNRGA